MALLRRINHLGAASTVGVMFAAPERSMTDQSTAPPPGLESLPLDTTPDAKRKKKKDKVRAAWISFVGRIIAQFVGAAATIGLGLFLLQRHQPAPASLPPIARVAVKPASGAMSIAVLPLQNFSSEPRHESFADAMTEALITDLARIDGLRVISRTSSMQYKRQKKSLPEIARELSVDAIVEGSIVHADGRVRITAQLIDASTDEHVWAQHYDRSLRDVLSVQSDVSKTIAQQVNIALASRQPITSAQRADAAQAEVVNASRR